MADVEEHLDQFGMPLRIAQIAIDAEGGRIVALRSDGGLFYAYIGDSKPNWLQIPDVPGVVSGQGDHDADAAAGN